MLPIHRTRVFSLVLLSGFCAAAVYYYSRELTPTFALDIPRAWDVDFSPDGKLLAIAGVQDSREEGVHTQVTEHSQGFLYDAASGRLVFEAPAGGVSVSSAMYEGRIRLALAYSHKAPIEILGAKSTPDGERITWREYALQQEDPTPAWVRLTRDGEFLGVLGGRGFRMYHLTNDGGELLFQVAGTLRPEFLSFIQPLEIAQKSQRVAFAFKNRFEVRTIPDGQVILSARGEVTSLSISADGRRLAVLHTRSPRVRIYNLP